MSSSDSAKWNAGGELYSAFPQSASGRSGWILRRPRIRVGHDTAAAKQCIALSSRPIVDDSSRTGDALTKAVQKLEAAGTNLPPVTTCVVYGTSAVRDRVISSWR